MDRAVAAPFLYPAASEAALKSQYVGRTLSEIPTPAAVIDRAVARKNCDRMLKATGRLGVAFRPHVKTHKVSCSAFFCYGAVPFVPGEAACTDIRRAIAKYIRPSPLVYNLL